MIAPEVLALLLAVAQARDSLTLEQALSRARERRPQVAVAAAVVERARGARRVGLAIPNPSTQLERDDLAPTAKLTVAQPLAWLVRRPADLASGRAVVERANAESAQLLADVARETRRAFFGALAANERLRLLAEQAALADSLVVLAGRRVAAGDISALERDQVAQEAARARLAAWQAREAAAVARVELARAVAWTATESPRPAGALGDGLDAPADPLLSAAPASAEMASAIAGVPALRTALADSSAAAARLLGARVAQLPIPTLVAGREWGGAGFDGHNAMLGVALPFPLWSQGREAVAEARGAAAEAAARLAEARLVAAAQVEQARSRVAESAARATFARDSLLPEARRIRAGAVRLYESGRTGILELFDALRAERDVAQAVVQELLAYQEARAELIARLGRWQ